MDGNKQREEVEEEQATSCPSEATLELEGETELAEKEQEQEQEPPRVEPALSASLLEQDPVPLAQEEEDEDESDSPQPEESSAPEFHFHTPSTSSSAALGPATTPGTPLSCGSAPGTPGSPPGTPGSLLGVSSTSSRRFLASSSESFLEPDLSLLREKSHDYLLKVLLVGDSDVGKQEILAGCEEGNQEAAFCTAGEGAANKQTTILIDNKRVKLQLWDTSGQGRFCTIIRSYSRGAQGILLVYDITNRWSFEGIQRWLKEVDQHAPGVPKVLVGNRLHLAFKRQVDQLEAEEYASKNGMAFFEVSPLVNFNIQESFSELARLALKRNGMERLWRSSKVTSLYELCAHAIVKRTTVYGIDRLPLPTSVKQTLKSYALTSPSAASSSLLRPGAHYKSIKAKRAGGGSRTQVLIPADAVGPRCGPGSKKSCVLS